MPKSVCIIGAGPSGLVAAKTLSHHHQTLSLPTPIFTTTLYDAHSTPGGLWPPTRTTTTRPIHPDMTANLSRHTVQFSDLPWDDSLPPFPRAWMVGDYLARYTKTYLEGKENVEMRLGRKVCSARRREGGGWVVESKAVGEGRWTERERDVREFDYLVVASGYFGQKRVPDWAKDVKDAERKIPVVHSTEYKDPKALIGEDNPGHKILVVGGQMSGVEIATSIASELSSATHSPPPKSIANPVAYSHSVHHLSDRHAWVIPLFTTPTPEEKAPIFLPSDINSCNLSKRPHPLTNLRGGLISEDAARAGHERIQASLGTDKSELHPLMRLTDPSTPPYVAISQFYPSLVRSGQITLSRGRLSSPHEIPSKTGIPLSDIAAVVLATGFDPSPSLSYLPPDVLETIGHAPEYPDLTPALAFHGTHHPSIPDLGFAGFYRGPYWGVSEMQSRFLSHLWTPQDISRSEALTKALAEDRSVEELLSMRGNPRTSQFPMGDYPYLMQEFSRALDLPISPSPPSLNPDIPLDILTPARYTYPSQPTANISTSLSQTQACAEKCLTSPKFLAAAVFRNLLGTWTLHRTIKSALPSHPSGTFTGNATFNLRRKTTDGLKCLPYSAPPNPTSSTSTSNPAAENEPFNGQKEGWEYLYEEIGTFTTPTFSFPARRRYIYRYDESADTLSAWFARVEDPSRADYLFHEVEFLPRSPGDSAVKAKAGHLCVDDYYSVRYEFEFRGVEMERWSLGYDVRGPKKEYSLHGVYTRAQEP